MSPTPDAQPDTLESTDSRMRKKRFDKRYDPETESLTDVVLEVGDHHRTYRLEFDHSSHGRLVFQRLTTAAGEVWEDIDSSAPADVHEAIRVAGRVAQDDRLGTDTPLTGTTIGADIDLYDDINPDGYVQSAESEDAMADGDD